MLLSKGGFLRQPRFHQENHSATCALLMAMSPKSILHIARACPAAFPVWEGYNAYFIVSKVKYVYI